MHAESYAYTAEVLGLNTDAVNGWTSLGIAYMLACTFSCSRISHTLLNAQNCIWLKDCKRAFATCTACVPWSFAWLMCMSSRQHSKGHFLMNFNSIDLFIIAVSFMCMQWSYFHKVEDHVLLFRFHLPTNLIESSRQVQLWSQTVWQCVYHRRLMYPHALFFYIPVNHQLLAFGRGCLRSVTSTACDHAITSEGSVCSVSSPAHPLF